MKIAHINIRSVFTGFNVFSNLVQEKDFDVVMVTETWLSDDVDSQIISIPGYRFFRKDRGSRGGGIGAYVKLSYNNCHEVHFDFAISDQLECLFIKIKLRSFTLAIGAFYRPPGTNVNTFINDFDNILSTVCPTVDEVVCLGDFNVNFFNIYNPIEPCFQSYNFTQLITEPTRMTSHSSTLLDPVFISNTNLVNSFGTISTDGISDHRMVFCDLKINNMKMKPKYISFRCFNNFDLNTFLVDLHNVPWYNIIFENDIDNKIDLFNDYVISLFDKHAPIRFVRVTKPKAPWLTPNLKLIMKERDKALQKYKRTNSNTDWLHYKNLRNYTLSIVRREKKNYLEYIASQNNLKKTWSTLSTLSVHSNKEVLLPIELSNPNDINNYFASFIQNVSDKCDDQINFYNNHKYNENITFSFTLTSVDEVNKTLNNIKTGAYGADHVSSTMLKYCSPFIDPFITHIINCCIEQNYFPQMWKLAIGIPLPKNSNPSSFSDLRIISILPAISKIFEKILYNQIYHYFILNNLLPDSQCGFRKGFSTATALATVTDDLIRAQDRGLVSVLVLLDYSKAFDTINHSLICSKLKYFGFDNLSVMLIKSYLHGRLQKISVNNVSSSSIDILSGVPQGSILGPLLFIIYTADILKSINMCKVQAYADDTQLYFQFDVNDHIHAVDVINSELQMIKQLSDEHDLKLNSSKSNLILFGSNNKKLFLKDKLNIQIDGVHLPVIDHAKNLGVILDTDLRFKEHVKKLLQKSYSSLKLIYANRDILNFKLKKILCESLVLSHFSYCDFIYGPCLDQFEKNRIQKVQNSCCRLIHGLRKFDHISHKVREIKWLNMENRRELHLGNFVHKLLVTPIFSPLKNKFILRSTIHNRNIRFNNKFAMPHHRLALFTRSFTYNAIKLYNSLPDEFKLFNINKFKYKLKYFIFCKQ